MISEQDYKTLLEIFKYDEGLRLKPYKDSKGLWTIGIGRLIGQNIQDLNISENLAEWMFAEDFGTALRAAVDTIGLDLFMSLPLPRKAAVLTLAFTLGVDKFKMFKETIAAMKKDDWQEVSRRILTTKWARDVDPRQRPGAGRDDRIAYMFDTGRWHPEYKITT